MSTDGKLRRLEKDSASLGTMNVISKIDLNQTVAMFTLVFRINVFLYM